MAPYSGKYDAVMPVASHLIIQARSQCAAASGNDGVELSGRDLPLWMVHRFPETYSPSGSRTCRDSTQACVWEAHRC